uniref:Uncharacterized protein n=1 Tax=Neobodo designis TaxID=312471 RepID=A0A7S1QUL0_NEODS|mmetsp:Transcript_5264/g.16712  ORF Transcript_5264/g.16712 Transcript_5264/m.16712 type:complete len:251 (+) Transcript_5264:133-885(+)
MPSHIEEEHVENVVQFTSLLLWLPHLAGLAYNCIDAANSQRIMTAVFAAVIYTATVVAAKRAHGDALMLIMFCAGLGSELLGAGASDSTDYYVSRNTWIGISAVQGLFAGILCKAKDMMDGRYFEFHTIGERLYLVTPFTVGIWTAHLIMHGVVQGFSEVMSSVFFCLALVGYGVLTYRIVAWSGVLDMDLIAVVNHLFTTSFGVVFVGLAITFITVSYLAIPFVSSLLQLNGVLSSLGILVELVVYDNA